MTFVNKRQDEELLNGFFSDYPSVMRDPVPFKVLLLVANGINNPKNIAGALEVKPPSVIYQLHRLKHVGFVKIGEKEGKVQHYEIDWEGLGRAFSRITGCWKDADKIVENSLFRDLVKEAFNAAGKFAVKNTPESKQRRLKRWKTSLEDFFHEFKIALIKSFPEIEKDKSNDAQSAELKKLLEDCSQKFMKYYGTRGDLFWRIAFEQVGIVEKKFSSFFGEDKNNSLLN